jgi:hypothetical protein
VHALNDPALAADAPTASVGNLELAICLPVMGGGDTASVGATAERLSAGWVEPLQHGVASSPTGFDGIGLDELAAGTASVARP